MVLNYRYYLHNSLCYVFHSHIISNARGIHQIDLQRVLICFTHCYKFDFWKIHYCIVFIVNLMCGGALCALARIVLSTYPLWACFIFFKICLLILKVELYKESNRQKKKTSIFHLLHYGCDKSVFLLSIWHMVTLPLQVTMHSQPHLSSTSTLYPNMPNKTSIRSG